MPVMDVRIVGMDVCQHRMVMGMRMRLGPVPSEGVLMRVMLVMAVPVAVLERMVRMAMLVSLPQVQPETYPH